MLPCRQLFSVLCKFLSKNVCPKVDIGKDRYGNRVRKRDMYAGRDRHIDRDEDRSV